MRILYIWDSDYPWDVRVEKICNSLNRAGHEVHIAARNLKKRIEYENMDGLHVHRLRSWKSDRINFISSFPAFFSPVWKKFLGEIVKANAIEVILVRDLPMAPAGIWAGKRNNIPVIFDMAEDYVAMVRDIWRARKFQGLNLFVRNPYLAKKVENYALRSVDHILVVVEEARDLVLKNGGNADKISIVGNTPLLDAFDRPMGALDDVLEKMAQRYSALYVGGIQMGRGIQTVLEAIPQTIRNIQDFLFVVVGDGYAREKLEAHANSLGVQDYVLWAGWVDHENIYDYIRMSKVGIIPHLVTDHVNTTMPNKIYDFMGMGIPVAASDSRPMQRLLVAEGCGMNFSSGNPGDLARVLGEIHDSSFPYGENGRNAVLSRYNWEHDDKRLLDAVNHYRLVVRGGS